VGIEGESTRESAEDDPELRGMGEGWVSEFELRTGCTAVSVPEHFAACILHDASTISPCPLPCFCTEMLAKCQSSTCSAAITANSLASVAFSTSHLLSTLQQPSTF
jgi:hypothetical protein